MEGDVVFAHELDVLDFVGTFVGAPPAFPIGIRSACGIGPFLGAGDVFDGGVEPDVEDLAFHAGPRLGALFDRDAPIEVACDATILQPIAVVEPFLGNRRGQDRPVFLAFDPGVQFEAHGRLAQVKMLGFAYFKVGRA